MAPARPSCRVLVQYLLYMRLSPKLTKASFSDRRLAVGRLGQVSRLVGRPEIGLAAERDPSAGPLAVAAGLRQELHRIHLALHRPAEEAVRHLRSWGSSWYWLEVECLEERPRRNGRICCSRRRVKLLSNRSLLLPVWRLRQ